MTLITGVLIGIIAVVVLGFAAFMILCQQLVAIERKRERDGEYEGMDD